MNMNGNLQQKKSYAGSHSGSGALVLELFYLMLAGAFATFLHHKLRVPLNLPGHHGLEFMAIFTFIRMSSGMRYAASIAMIGTGIVLLMPGFGAASPLHSIGYLLPGIVLDLLYGISKNWTKNILHITLIAGIAYMSIPLSRLILFIVSGYPNMAFIKFGPAYTIMSFFFFGMLGGMLGFGLNSIKQSINKKPKTN